jgi:hypothetical protein
LYVHDRVLDYGGHSLDGAEVGEGHAVGYH